MAQEYFDTIQKIIDDNKVALFMKGDREQPLCGFSARVIQILEHIGVPYKEVNILEDDGLRQAIKDFSDWPTIPQLYVKGEFVGGCDIVTEMFTNGELQTVISEVA